MLKRLIEQVKKRRGGVQGEEEGEREKERVGEDAWDERLMRVEGKRVKNSQRNEELKMWKAWARE